MLAQRPIRGAGSLRRAGSILVAALSVLLALTCRPAAAQMPVRLGDFPGGGSAGAPRSAAPTNFFAGGDGVVFLANVGLEDFALFTSGLDGSGARLLAVLSDATVTPVMYGVVNGRALVVSGSTSRADQLWSVDLATGERDLLQTVNGAIRAAYLAPLDEGRAVVLISLTSCGPCTAPLLATDGTPAGTTLARPPARRSSRPCGWRRPPAPRPSPSSLTAASSSEARWAIPPSPASTSPMAPARGPSS